MPADAGAHRAKALRHGDAGGTTFVEADTQQLPFPDDHFQIVSVAFGLRNVCDTMRGLQEMVRVCQPGGQVAILEFSLPAWAPLRAIYGWYFRNVLPRIGQALARSSDRAYSYLPESVGQFPYGEELARLLRAAGLRDAALLSADAGHRDALCGAKMSARNLVLAISGASGVVYATRLLDVLVSTGHHVHLCISPSGQLVLKQELGISVNLEDPDIESLLVAGRKFMAATGLKPQPEPRQVPPQTQKPGRIHYHRHDDLMAPIASGSFLTEGMVICPCSGSTLGAVVHGTGENLIHRAAQVHLKERRKLILVPRETPLSIIQLGNLKLAAEAGAVVLPAMPGFYHGVAGVADLVDFIVTRICDQLGIPNTLMQRWGDGVAQ